MTEVKATNVTWHKQTITREDREHANGHKGATIWFTGLSGSGKSTLANALSAELFQHGIHTFELDGDNIRHGLNKNLGFSPSDRTENIRRIGEVAKLFTQAGIINTVSFISPYRTDRDAAKAIQGPNDFLEIYVKVDLDTAEGRDTKGLYKKAKAGLIPEFTGISAPYEEPLNPDLILDTALLSVEQCVSQLLELLLNNGIIPQGK